MVAVRDVHYAAGGRPIFAGLDLEVRRGRITAIMGPSGTGKTTLLRLITRQVAPARGQVTVFGEDLAGLGRSGVYALRRRMGMLFQNGALYSALTVYQNIAFPLRERGELDEAAIKAIVYAKLEQVELEAKHANLLPASLSGGMVKRVSLARALALSPDLLVLDEPTAGLDPDRSEAFVKLIRQLRTDHQFAVLMVTHDLDTLYDLSDRVAVLADQHIIACGPLNEVRDHPHRFVQNFFGGNRGKRAFEGG